MNAQQTDFTSQDAQLLIQTAQNAPLQNMQHAAVISTLLQRFQVFYQQATAPAAPSADAEAQPGEASPSAD